MLYRICAGHVRAGPRLCRQLSTASSSSAASWGLQVLGGDVAAPAMPAFNPDDYMYVKIAGFSARASGEDVVHTLQALQAGSTLSPQDLAVRMQEWKRQAWFARVLPHALPTVLAMAQRQPSPAPGITATASTFQEFIRARRSWPHAPGTPGIIVRPLPSSVVQADLVRWAQSLGHYLVQNPDVHIHRVTGDPFAVVKLPSRAAAADFMAAAWGTHIQAGASARDHRQAELYPMP